MHYKHPTPQEYVQSTTSTFKNLIQDFKKKQEKLRKELKKNQNEIEEKLRRNEKSANSDLEHLRASLMKILETKYNESYKKEADPVWEKILIFLGKGSSYYDSSEMVLRKEDLLSKLIMMKFETEKAEITLSKKQIVHELSLKKFDDFHEIIEKINVAWENRLRLITQKTKNDAFILEFIVTI